MGAALTSDRGWGSFKMSSPQIWPTLLLSFNYNLTVRWNDTKDKRVFNLSGLFPIHRHLLKLLKRLCSHRATLCVDALSVGARRKSRRHRSELKHLFPGRAPPLPADPQTGFIVLCESEQPDPLTPCWVCYWQHNFSSRIDHIDMSHTYSATTWPLLMYSSI